MRQPHPVPSDHCPVNKELRSGANWPLTALGTLSAREPHCKEDTEGVRFCQALTCLGLGAPMPGSGACSAPPAEEVVGGQELLCEACLQNHSEFEQIGQHWPQELAASEPQRHNVQVPW